MKGKGCFSGVGESGFLAKVFVALCLDLFCTPPPVGKLYYITFREEICGSELRDVYIN